MSDPLEAEYAALSSSGIVKRVAKQSAVYAAGLWAGGAAAFVLTPIYTRYLTPDGYGVLELLNRTGGIFMTFLKMGMVAAVLRFYHHYPDESARLKVISTGVLLVLSAGGFALAGAVVASPYISQLIFRTPHQALLCSLAVASGFAELGFLLPGTLLRVREQVTLYTAAAVGKFALAIVANVILVVVLRKGVLGVVLANAIAVGVFAVAFTWYTLRRTGVHISRDAVRRLLMYGLPLTAAAIPGLVISTSDRYILMYARGSHAVGIYALATKFGMLLQMLVFEPFTFVYSVFIFKIAATADPERTYGRVMTYLVLAGGWLALGLALLSPEAVRIIAGARYDRAATMIPAYLLGSFLFGISPMFEIGLYLKNKTFWKPLIVAFEAGAIVVLNLALIPRFGGVGAAWAYAISQLIFCATLFVASQRYVRVSYEWGRLTVLAGAAPAFLILGHVFGKQWGWEGTGLRALLGLSFPFVLWAARFYSREELDEWLTAARGRLRIGMRSDRLEASRAERGGATAARAVWPGNGGWRQRRAEILAPVAEPLLRRASDGVLILRYHSIFPVGTERDALVSPSLCTPPGQFDRQMAHIAARYRPLSLDDVVERLREGRPLPADGVVVTFDDGYADNYDLAAPILLKHGVPATFFVTSEWVGDGRAPWPAVIRYALERTEHSMWTPRGGVPLPLSSEADRLHARRQASVLLEGSAAEERSEGVAEICRQLEVEPPIMTGMMMSWAQVRELARVGFTVGAHSATHPNLARVSSGELRREVVGSVERIADETGAAVCHFAYPNPFSQPNFTPAVVEVLRAAGCASACTTLIGRVGRDGDVYAIPRVAISDNNPRTFMLRAMRSVSAAGRRASR
jgi:O-antigen/teichoic acid export membrane protein/peptidoglycan/xylan/chitin deacetylase (PgdA/CDA1 family)